MTVRFSDVVSQFNQKPLSWEDCANSFTPEGLLIHQQFCQRRTTG
jgi:hypothetical protein